MFLITLYSVDTWFYPIHNVPLSKALRCENLSAIPIKTHRKGRFQVGTKGLIGHFRAVIKYIRYSVNATYKV